MKFPAILLLAAGLAGPLNSALAAPVLLELKPEQLAQAGIKTVAAGSLEASGEHLLPAQVVIDPRHLEILAAPLSGIVTRVAVVSGETVKKGQLLGQLRGAQLLELQRDYLAARAQAETADEARRRDEALFNDGIIPRSRLAQTLAAQRQAAAGLAEKRQSLHLAGLGEPGEAAAGFNGLVTLRAPFDGVVLEAPLQPGQRVESNALLFKLGKLSPLSLEIQAGAAIAGELRPGDAIAIDGCASGGRVTVVAESLSSASQSVMVRGELARPAGCVRPYQQLQLRVKAAAANSRRGWVIPREALVRHQGQDWVFVQVAQGYRPEPVKLIGEYEQTLRVEGRLDAATPLVVKGASALKAHWLGLGGR